MTTAKNVNGVVRITPPVKPSKQVMVIILIFLSVILFIAITVIWLKSKSKSDENLPKENPSGQTEITVPSIYTEYHTLKQGEIIRVKVPSEYSHTCAGGGKKYYYQAQNASKPIICGGGGYIDAGEKVAYFDLSYYNEEIVVVCEFKKLQY